MENLGFIFALAAALAWGSYMVPFKKANSSNVMQFQAVMGVGILISGLIISLLMGYSLSLNMYGLMAGIIWASANVVSLVAVNNLGLSKGVPFISSLGILSSFLLGAIAFNELPSGFLIPAIGIALIIFGVVLAGSTGKNQSKNLKVGLITGALAGIGFGTQFVPIKISQVIPHDYFFSMSVGVFVSASVFFIAMRSKFSNEAIKESLLSGLLWTIGNLAGVLSISMIGLAKGFPITQAAVLVAVLWGLFYFKEITQTKERRQVLIGASILLLGVIILGLN